MSARRAITAQVLHVQGCRQNSPKPLKSTDCNQASECTESNSQLSTSGHYRQNRQKPAANHASNHGFPLLLRLPIFSGIILGFSPLGDYAEHISLNRGSLLGEPGACAAGVLRNKRRQKELKSMVLKSVFRPAWVAAVVVTLGLLALVAHLALAADDRSRRTKTRRWRRSSCLPRWSPVRLM